MMEGITILNTIPVYALTDMAVLCSFIGVILGVTFFTLSYFLSENYNNISSDICAIISILLSIGCFAFHFIALLRFPKELTYYKYEVLINEDVNLVDFYEKYDIIEKKNEIYVIKEKKE